MSLDNLFAPGIDNIEQRIEDFKVSIQNKRVKADKEAAELARVRADAISIREKIIFISGIFNKTIPDSKASSLGMDPFEQLHHAVGVLKPFQIYGSRVLSSFLFFRGWALAHSLTSAKAAVVAAEEAWEGSNEVAALAKVASLGKALKVADTLAIIGGSINVALGIAAIVLAIVNAKEKREKLDEYRGKLEQLVNDIDTAIASINQDTKTIIEALIEIFDDYKIDYDKAFSSNHEDIMDLPKYETAVKTTRQQMDELIRDAQDVLSKKEVAQKLLASGTSLNDTKNITALSIDFLKALQKKAATTA